MIEIEALRLTAPDACIVGVIQQGETFGFSGDPVPEAPCNAVLLHPLTEADALTRAQTISHFLALRRAGATLLLISHDEPLLERCADEIWWLRDQQLVARGDPAEVLPLYRRHVAAALRMGGQSKLAAMAPVLRDGDGRAELRSLEILGENGTPSTVWRSGEDVAIRVTVAFLSEVADPVVGILIRTRIGLNVYGTNTDLENLHPGPLRQGEKLCVTFRFRCDLCPGDYTVTAASHDPDGVWHDWQEDAVALSVTDVRYTAGVANLRAKVYAEVTR